MIQSYADVCQISNHKFFLHCPSLDNSRMGQPSLSRQGKKEQVKVAAESLEDVRQRLESLFAYTISLSSLVTILCRLTVSSCDLWKD